MSGGNVTMADLPEELTEHILSFLDAESLLSCAGVNAAWNKMTNNVGNKIWFEACLKAGIYAEKDKFGDARDWKAFLSSMLPRLKAMQDSTCFSTVHYDQANPIRAIYYHNEKIALAFSSRIEIRNASQEEILNEFECCFEPAYLKFDDKILVAASRYGIVSFWSTTTGNCLRRYINPDHNNILVSFDFLPDHDIVATSYAKYRHFTRNIHIWSMSSDDVCIKNSANLNTLGKVMLAPNRHHPINEQETSCYLFGLTIHYVFVWTVKLQNRKLSVHRFKSFFIPANPFRRCLQRAIHENLPWGCPLLFDGEEVYIMTQLPRSNSRIIWAWNFKTNSIRYLDNDERVVNLLGVGEKYIAYEIEVGNNFRRVVVASKIAAKIIAIIRMERPTAPAKDHFLCLGNTSWLDGINGENDSGVVCSMIAEDRLSAYVTQFVPRNERRIF